MSLQSSNTYALVDIPQFDSGITTGGNQKVTVVAEHNLIHFVSVSIQLPNGPAWDFVKYPDAVVIWASCY